VAEGAPLLRAYRLIPIEGSNPSLSAIYVIFCIKINKLQSGQASSLHPCLLNIDACTASIHLSLYIKYPSKYSYIYSHINLLSVARPRAPILTMIAEFLCWIWPIGRA
jgi:hypothetical protein